MIGLIYLVIGFVYLLLSIWLVVLAVRAARRRGRAGWKWGLGAGLVMYLLVFWDWIPTVVAHKYYCSRYAGFTQYKSVDQWKDENLEDVEKLIPNDSTQATNMGGNKRYRLNQRLAWDVYQEDVFLGQKVEKKIIDETTESILARYVDFSTDIQSIGLGSRSLRDYKIWLKNDSCEYPGKKNELKKFNKLKWKFQQIGEESYGSGKAVSTGSNGGS